MMLRRIFTVALGACALATSACGADPSRPRLFSTDWLDDSGKTIGEVHARLRDVHPAGTSDLAVAVAGKNDKLVGVLLAGGEHWTFAHPIDVRPVIAGGVVVGSGGGEVFALDAATGKKLWSRATGGLPLVGAGDDGTLTALTLARPAGTTLLVVGRDGNVKRQLETSVRLGDPAVLGGVVFVPWANQYVSAIEASTGDEIGRATLRDKVSQALRIGDRLYFGESVFVRFDERIAMASRGGASRVALPSRELPGTPRLLVPGGEKQPPVANARDRDRLFARPAAGSDEALRIDAGRYYASYYRLVYGFDASNGHLTWVHAHPSDVLGGEAVTGGVAVCDEQGKLSVFEARAGNVTLTREFGEPIHSCVVHADTFRAAASTGTGAGAPLAAQISEAVSIQEPELATGQRLLLRELGTLPDESATKTLVDLASDPRQAPVLVADARAALATRRTGSSFMLAALGKHYDFLADVLMTPPVGPISDALAAMKERRGAPLLADHLFDPADTDDDVRRASAAMAVLATKDELPALRRFLAMYRGTGESEDLQAAVGSVAEGIVRLDPKDGRALVEATSKDPTTDEPVRQRLEAVLAAVKTDAPAGEKTAPKKEKSSPNGARSSR